MLHNLYKCWYKLTSTNLKVNTEIELNTILFEKEAQIINLIMYGEDN